MGSSIQRLLWLYFLKLLIVSHLLVKIDGYRRSCSRDITDLIFYVIWQDQVIEWPCDFMEENFSLYIPTLSSSVDKVIVVVDV